MNVNDADVKGLVIPKTPFEQIKGIFARQAELHEKYKGIEEGNGLGLGFVVGRPFSIDDPVWQYIIKDYAWRVTEEITEAIEAADHSKVHLVEELIDALHFYTEMLILCDIQPTHFEKYTPRPTVDLVKDPLQMLNTTYHIGIACNLLKNKPWKNTHVLTDWNRFVSSMVLGYVSLLNTIFHHVGSMEALYVFYHKKALVNVFRQNSNY